MKHWMGHLVGILAVLASASGLAEHHEMSGESCAKRALVIQADFEGLVMTGVAYSVCPELDVFNVRPLIPLYDIRAASDSLEYNAQTWPAGTVFVSVVDPGVGTPRKSVVLQTKNDLYFVSPDNGSLSGPARAYGIKAVREIDETVNRRPNTEWAHTFHGRDVYSYTGARLAAGVISFDEVGPLLPAKIITLETLPGSFEDGVFRGHVLGGVDRLGNAFFNIDRAMFELDQAQYGDLYDVVISNQGETYFEGAIPYARSFGSVEVGENLLFINSSGDLSVAINQGNFAEKYFIEAGVDWKVTLERQQ
ncbi:MAG: SAM-dependent chlorinase/fluorinase [Pseudomonadota bacterium]